MRVDVDVRYFQRKTFKRKTKQNKTKQNKTKQNKTKCGPTSRLVIDPTSRRISRVLFCFVLLAREIDNRNSIGNRQRRRQEKKNLAPGEVRLLFCLGDLRSALQKAVQNRHCHMAASISYPLLQNQTQ